MGYFGINHLFHFSLKLFPGESVEGDEVSSVLFSFVGEWRARGGSATRFSSFLKTSRAPSGARGLSGVSRLEGELLERVLQRELCCVFFFLRFVAVRGVPPIVLVMGERVGGDERVVRC